MNISSFIFFSSFLISFEKFSCHFNGDILNLIFDFASGSVANSGSVAGSGVGSCVENFSKLFIGNNLLLKLLRTFSIAVINDYQVLFYCFVTG